jgi:putative ABC transport system ATP-binding protein
MIPAVAVNNLEFAYQDDRPVLRIESFTMGAGQHCFIQGASGSGKSTFLGLLSGMLLPRKGEVWIKGRNIVSMTASQRDRFRGCSIGYLAQMFNLIPYLSARDNICLPLSLHRTSLNSARNKRLQELVEILDMSSFLDRPARELSVGQQQRVAAARAFILEPALVIADEPTSSLDEKQKNNLVQCLMDMAERRSISLVVASHDSDLRKYFPMTFDPGASLCL